MEKLTIILLLAATFNLGQNPAETDIFSQKTTKIDEFGRTQPLVLQKNNTAKAAFLNQNLDQKSAPADASEFSQKTEAAFPPKALLDF